MNLQNKDPGERVERVMSSEGFISERFGEQAVPPIRSCRKINVNLSSREFITPKRESQENAEREWCAKQHEMMVNGIGFHDEDLNSNERDILWVVKKGHDFLEKKHYQAALSAFSFGMKITNDFPEFYLGRARAQYALKNYKCCVSSIFC